MKNSVQTMNKDSNRFINLKNNFLRISKAIIKEGIFISSQIIEVVQDSTYEGTLNPAEKAAQNSFKMVTAM
jgi:hypothetical protein